MGKQLTIYKRTKKGQRDEKEALALVRFEKNEKLECRLDFIENISMFDSHANF